MSKAIFEDPTSYLCPRIISADQHQVYYGGDQSWLLSNTAFKGGCGPVCGANIIAVFADRNPEYQKSLSLNINDKHFITQDEYIHLLNDVYCNMSVKEVPLLNSIYNKMPRSTKLFSFIPSTFGIGIVGFTRGVLLFAKKNNINLQFRSKNCMFTSYMSGLTFIKLALANGYPIVLLTTNSRFQYTLHDKPYLVTGNKKKMRRHFVTITAIREKSTCSNSNGPTLTISTWGKSGTICYNDLYKSWQSPLAFGSSMVYFTPAKTKRTAKRALIKAYTILLKR